MQAAIPCEETALKQENQAQIYCHYVAAILALETSTRKKKIVLFNSENLGDALLKVVPSVFLPLSHVWLKKIYVLSLKLALHKIYNE